MSSNMNDMTGIFELDEKLTELIALPAGALITPGELRRVCVKYVDFGGAEQVGNIVCAREAARDIAEIFAGLFEARYPIEKIRYAHEYGGDDDLIMGDNATSAFNYRFVANTQTLSLHAKGLAIDINPLYNPYIQNGVVMPANAAPYADRSADFPHKITHGDLCFELFRKHGWLWGGDWTDDKDYQHFYKPEGVIKRLRAKVGI